MKTRQSAYNRRQINACCVSGRPRRSGGVGIAQVLPTWGRLGRGGGPQARSVSEHLLRTYCVPRAAALRSEALADRRDPRPRPAPPRPRPDPSCTSARLLSLQPVPPPPTAARSGPQSSGPSRDPRGSERLPTPRPRQRLLDIVSAAPQNLDTIGSSCRQSFCNAYRLRKAVFSG